MRKQYWFWSMLFVWMTFAGCVNLSGAGSREIFFLLFTAFILGIGCVQVITVDGEKSNTENQNEQTSDASTPDGRWESCCLNGKISQCFCPAGMSCNYGWYTDCGNNTCIMSPGAQCKEPIPETKPEPIQEAQPDGTWDPCCQNGKISKCFCPAGAACNYGWYTDCGNGTCVDGPNAQCKEPIPEVKPEPIQETISEPQPDGSWDPCCQNGKISKCFCPAGVSCNYGWYTDCGNGTCADGPGAQCKEPIPETKPEPIHEPQPDGIWETCCQNGKISKCFCPAGVACNYGQYTNCGNETCVGPIDKCP